MKKKNEAVSLLLIVIAGISWGFTGIFARYFQNMGVDSASVTAIRIVSAAICLTLTLFFYDRSLFRIKFRDIWIFLCTGLVSLLVQTLLYFKCMHLTSIAVAAVLLYTAPMFVILLSALIFKEKLTAVKCVSVIIAVVGCGFVTGIFGAPQSVNVTGILFGLGAGLGYASYSIFSRFAINRGYRSLTITLYTFLLSLLGIVPMLLIMKSDISVTLSAFRTGGTLAVLMALGMGIIGAALPYMLYTMGLEGTEGGKASVTASVEPVAAAILGLIFYGEKLSPLVIFGMALVIFAIVLTSGVIKSRKGGNK